MDYTLEDRELIVADVIGRLMRGVPLAEICRSPGMPDPVTIARWENADADLKSTIALARAHGFHTIAARTRQTARGKTVEEGGDSSGDVYRDKLIIDTDLKLLAKWNPREYGEAVQMRMADANGEKLDTTPMIRELLALVRPSDGSQAIDVTPGVATTKKP